MPKLASEQSHALGKQNTQFIMLEAATNGDLEFAISPAAVTTDATSAARTRNVVVTCQNAAGKVFTAFTRDLTSGVSIADVSSAGTASIASTTLSFIEGTANVLISLDAAAWLAADTNTLTVAAYTGFAGVASIAGGTSVETFA